MYTPYSSSNTGQDYSESFRFKMPLQQYNIWSASSSKKQSVLTVMLVLTSYILWKVKSCHEYKLLFRQFFHVSSVQFRTYLAVNPVYSIVFLTMQFCCRFVQLNTDFSSLWTWSEKDLYGLQEIFVNHTEVIAVDIIFYIYIGWM